MGQTTKLLNPKLDFVFQALFGEQGCEKITKVFLEEILEIKIQKIELNKNPILRREKLEDKLGVLDVIAKINDDQNIDIEMQISNKDNIINRILYYWSRLYVRSIKKGQDYDKLEKSIAILIIEEKIAGLEKLQCHTEWKIIENKTRTKILTDKFEIHIIELEKLKSDTDSISEKLLNWLSFLQNPKIKRGMKNMDDDENERAIEEARQRLIMLSEDPQMQQLAWLREKGIYEENERRRELKEIREGRKEIEEGKKEIETGKKEIEKERQGIEKERQGIEKERQGIEKERQGIEKERQGIEKERQEIEKEKQEIDKQRKQIIKNIFSAGMTEQQVIEITGYTKEQIKELSK